MPLEVALALPERARKKQLLLSQRPSQTMVVWEGLSREADPYPNLCLTLGFQ